ncbi:ribosomal protein S6 kinase alpha-5 [Podospora aff. communis PSN243]|uniref:Ribosomal protein S6 kinase alpha-5 n=1 Tax=Podospora aff. communis PSN243 TaxID=3040156 RepID=A0AAV9GKG3_9PEZI|nr:ribosomal protein S6 kinase alpha-5 [Podospora aff. communis PSN243]
MELNSTSIHDVIHPTAAFSQSRPQVQLPEARSSPWSESQLNPKNRIDSLDPPLNPLWRVDGCTGLGTQYYAVPLFLGDIPPMRFDVFIPEEASSCPLLRQLLDLNAAFHIKDGVRVRRLGVSVHILRTLQAWMLNAGRGGFASLSDMYKNHPFGSRIIFENLDVDIRKIKITIAPTHYLEKQLLALSRLPSALGVTPELFPPVIDIADLTLVQQLHDSICLVRLRSSSGLKSQPRAEESERLWVLKALTSGTKYLYAELRNLLHLEPHPHVISHPDYLVTKYCRFGGKTGVVGFLIPYHRRGSLRDILPLLRVHGQLNLTTQLKWAIQLASAVLHVRERGRIFYPDLRLDNVLLSNTDDIVMVDFEQRGVWCEFAAPEVNALEYTRILASDDSLSQNAEPTIPEGIRERYAERLTRLLPDWETLQDTEEYSQLPHDYDSFNVPWQCLDAVEQEAAEVYMLGRVLWCIFEGQSAPQHAAVWQSYKWEPDYEFPEFRRTPLPLRDLIDRCTRGRRDVLSRLIARRGSRLVLRATPHGKSSDAAEVLRVAREWWVDEVKASDAFLQMREEMKGRGEWGGNYFDRPSLREVAEALEEFRASVGHAGR